MSQTAGAMPLEQDVAARLTTDRKWRLFACACWRRLWRSPEEVRLAEAVEAWADGGPEAPEVPQYWVNQQDARATAHDAAIVTSRVGREILDCLAGSPGPGGQIVLGDYVRLVGGTAWRAAGGPLDGVAVKTEGEKVWVFQLPQPAGQPYREAFEVVRGGACPAWRTPDVLSLARAAYGSQEASGTLDGFRLRLLADALEEAGCPGGHPLAAHLRAGSHWRGCWVIDEILGAS